MKNVMPLLCILFLVQDRTCCRASDSHESRIQAAIKKMSDPNPFVRMQGPTEISAFSFDVRPYRNTIVPELIRALKDPEETVRRNAAWALMWFGTDAKEALPTLIDLLNDPEPVPKPNVIGLLSQLGPDAKDAVPSLLTILKTDKDALNRWRVCGALEYIGEHADKTIPALVEAASDADPKVRQQAIRALWRYDRSSEEVQKVLLARMRDEVAEIRTLAIRVGWKLKIDPKIFVPVLKDAIFDPDSDVRDVATDALKSQGETALQIFLKNLDHQDGQIRYDAALALGFFGSESKIANAKLFHLLANDPETRVRARAAAALGAIGEPADEVVAMLKKALNDKERTVRLRAQEALDLIQSRSTKADKNK